MNTILSKYTLGDISLSYITDGSGHVGIVLLPTDKTENADFLDGNIESIVQLYIRGDDLPPSFASGITLSGSQSTGMLKYDGQTLEENGGSVTIKTRLHDGRGYDVLHTVTYKSGDRAFKINVRFTNSSESDAILENISSFSLGRLSPYGDKTYTNDVVFHRIRSWWSAEGKVESGTLSEYHLEPSWSLGGVRAEKFGQNGSMPVRHYFPFAAVEDKKAGVTWAVQLACPSSWQIEARRQREYLCLTGGLADYETGHWSKNIHPGESFDTPTAYVTVGSGGLDTVSQRLLDLHTPVKLTKESTIPVVFNEFCTTWGDPDTEKIAQLTNAIKGKGFDYLVIDCGWYGNKEWCNYIGDWEVSKKKFPNGIKEAADIISSSGIKPGLWFEAENCTAASNIGKNSDFLLKRNGYVIDSGRRYLNMSLPAVKAYLKEKVIDMLRDNGFKYVKIDYNDSIGLGCDDTDGLGEGLRKNMLASQEFFKAMRDEIPDLAIENCSSGGHRLEPSMMELCDFASFSDAHECVHIPIIAAALHRVIQPSKSQIWAVLHGSDSLRRTNYSIANTLLGVMCVSGDVYSLSSEQWSIVEHGIALHKKSSAVIRNGTSHFYGSMGESYSDPTGWQAVVRYDEETNATLAVIHTFGGEIPKCVSLPVKNNMISDVLCSEGNAVILENGRLNVELKENFEAVAVLLRN